MENLESNKGYCPVFRSPKILHFSRDFVAGTFGEEGKRSWSHAAKLSFFCRCLATTNFKDFTKFSYLFQVYIFSKTIFLN